MQSLQLSCCGNPLKSVVASGGRKVVCRKGVILLSFAIGEKRYNAVCQRVFMAVILVSHQDFEILLWRKMIGIRER